MLKCLQQSWPIGRGGCFEEVGDCSSVSGGRQEPARRSRARRRSLEKTVAIAGDDTSAQATLMQMRLERRAARHGVDAGDTTEQPLALGGLSYHVTAPSMQHGEEHVSSRATMMRCHILHASMQRVAHLCIHSGTNRWQEV